MWGAIAAKVVGEGMKIGGTFLQKGPDVPDIPNIDVTAEQKKALQGNLQNYGLINQLTQKANEAGIKSGLAKIDALMGAGTRQQITDLIQQGLRGELPKDVTDLIQRRAAESATARGVPGSIFARNLELRDLGLTSLQYTQQALDTAQRWLATSASQIQQYDFTNMFVTPAQAIAQANINAQNQFQRDWLSNQIENAFSSQNKWAQVLYEQGQNISSLGGIMGMFGGAGGGAAGAGAGAGQFGTVF